MSECAECICERAAARSCTLMQLRAEERSMTDLMGVPCVTNS